MSEPVYPALLARLRPGFPHCGQTLRLGDTVEWRHTDGHWYLYMVAQAGPVLVVPDLPVTPHGEVGET